MDVSAVDGERISRHCRQIDRCNQRGGRMLSVLDLIEAGTMSAELAAYALAAIGGGASFLVGALPGGAGKTTVMGALLNFAPNDVELVAADGSVAIERGMKSPRPRCCYICHEIGDAPYYAYLWSGELRAYFGLAEAGHMLATNLHADDYAQAVSQICDDNRVPEAHMRRINLMFFLDVQRGGRRYQRRIGQVWESDGQQPHRRIFTDGAQADWAASSILVSKDDVANAHNTIEQITTRQARTIEEVRSLILDARVLGQ